MKTLNSAELASAARRAAGPGGCRGQAASGFTPCLPCLTHTLASSSCQSLRFLSEESSRWLFLFQYWKELWIFPLNTSKLRQVLRRHSVVSLDSHCISRFLLTASICPENRMMALCIPWSHSRDFCSEESRCDDNHTHLKWLEAYRAKLCSVLFRFNNV